MNTASNIPMSTATGIVSRLATKRYVERLTYESNRRIVTVRLAQQGEVTAAGIKDTVLKYWDLFTNILTDEEKEMLFKLFIKVIALFDQTSTENPEGEKTVKEIQIE